MGVTAMEGLGLGVLLTVGDPDTSALRVIPWGNGTGAFPASISAPAGGLPVSAPAGGLPVMITANNTFTGGFLVSARSTTGTGNVLTALQNGGGYGAGFWTLNCTGNSASGQFMVSRDGVGWLALTATAMASGAATATGQWSGYFPYITFVNTWISAGSNLTGTTWVSLWLL